MPNFCGIALIVSLNRMSLEKVMPFLNKSGKLSIHFSKKSSIEKFTERKVFTKISYEA